MRVRLRASGRYRIMATSYASENTGTIGCRCGAGWGAAVATRPVATDAGRVFGVFVGSSNYGGRANNLMYTAEDARHIYAAMQKGAGMRPTDGVVLVDQQATLAAVRPAIQRIGSQAGPNDMFVLFSAGHGGRVPRQTFQPADPDHLDETLVFYDKDPTDDGLGQLLDGIHAKVTLLVLDACFSGGFSKAVISAPGRMGPVFVGRGRNLRRGGEIPGGRVSLSCRREVRGDGRQLRAHVR